MSTYAEGLPLDWVYRWGRERADQIFLTQPLPGNVRNWTWGQALNEARRVAGYLSAQPWDPGSRVAILSKNSAWWIMADLAIWMSGHVSVPVYPSLRAQTVRQILEHSGAKACFLGPVEPEAAPACEGRGIPWIGLPNADAETDLGWDSLIESSLPISGQPSRGADELATIIYTSGTTGAPKGVMHRFLGFAHDAEALGDVLGLRERQRVLSYLPLAHILERAGNEMPSLRLGNHVFFTAGIETFLEDLERARPTVFLSVPRLLVKFQQGVFAKMPKEKLDRLLRLPGVRAYVKHRILRQLGLNRVDHAACGGAPIPPEILLWYRKVGLRLGEGYGMTETMITHLPRPEAVRAGCVGPAIGGVEQRVTPEGELLVRSPMNMLGYYREPELTAAAFTPDGFFRTGDLATVDPDGQVRIIGRLKEQFKTSKGKYVAPAPIESRLMEHPAVEACCILGSGEPSPFAVVVLAAAVRERCVDPDERKVVETGLATCVEQINAELDVFERLSMVVVVNGPWTIGNGFMTPTLKIKRGSVEGTYQRLVGEWKAQGGLVVWESTPMARKTGMGAAAAAGDDRERTPGPG
jgi:long-chain acyl-CoA synthetase